MTEVKKVSSEIIHKSPWWEYKCDKIIRPNGDKGEYCYIETRGNSIVVPVLDDGRLILVRQYRYLSDKFSIEFPGGGIGASETPAEGAVRELLEESGYTTDSLIKIGAFEPSVGVIKDMSHVFIASELEKIQEPKSDEFEQTEVMFRRVDEFEDMIRRGEIWDGQVLAAWALVKDLILKNFHPQDLG
jgi:ADP-ribose pyrophosphatase